jgi:hypothetical protein
MPRQSRWGSGRCASDVWHGKEWRLKRGRGLGDLYRVLSNGKEESEELRINVPLFVYLADLENERDCLISRLRHIDRILVDNGRLRSETLPRRTR